MMLRLLLPPLLFFLVVSAEGFWIVAQPKEINWQQNCIQDKNCEDMELSIIMDSNSDELGSAQVSYKLDNALKNPQNSKMLFVYWTETQLSNITMKTLLTANDVLFNVPRPCDHSSALHVFSPTIKASAYNSPQTEVNEPDKHQTIGLVGKCFHVIIEVRLYIKNCPWCPSITATKQATSSSITTAISLDGLLESPAVVALVFFLLLVMFVGVIMCGIIVQKTQKLSNDHQQRYSPSSLSGVAFNRGHMSSAVSNIPMPPMLRPPLIPDESFRCHQISGKIHDGSTCPYYETLDNNHAQQPPPISFKQADRTNYDSAFDQSLTGSPNSSFSGQNLSDSGRCSPPPSQVSSRPRAEYV